MILQRHIAPDSGIVGAAHRALMVASAIRLIGVREPRARALARALVTTATGRFGPEEKVWIARIEERRDRVTSGGSIVAGELAAACPYWSIPRVWGRFLMSLVREVAPTSCLELGTGFGTSAAYQGAALQINGSGRLIALDQEERLAEIAREGFSELGLEERVILKLGPIGETLEAAASSAAPLGYAFIDAEHTERATVENFERLLPHLADGAVVVVDDIKVDEGMARAWKRISRNNRVSMALGLRRVGIVSVSGSSPRGA